jgi:FtsH-binding integral membrane protein
MMESSVFKRASYVGTQISPALYNVTIGLTLCWGFLVNWLIIQTIPVEMLYGYDTRIFFFGFIICAIAGSSVLNRSQNPVFSFLGYNLIVIPFGFVLNLVVSQFDSALVLEAVKVTGEISFMMMLLGAMYPKFFLSIGRGLFIALLVAVVVELVNSFLFHQVSTGMDWIVALIFSGYIGYDWARANAIPKTLDNAIDSAAALYLDIINLFLRVLRILSRR